MPSPGITKNVTVGDSWQRLGTLVNSTYPTELREGSAIANGCYIYVSAYDVQVAYGDTAPDLNTGHLLAKGDSTTWDNAAFIRRAWFRNASAGSAGIMAVTPIFGL